MKERQLVQEAAAEVQSDFLGLDHGDLCAAARTVLPFFEKLKAKTAGWKVWARVVYAGAIRALELLIDIQCRRL